MTTKVDTLDDLGIDSVDPKSFRLQNNKIHLTYPAHVVEKDLLEFIEKKCGKCKEYSIVNETGGTGHEHAHALFWFEKAVNTRSCRFFDYLDLHPNIKKVTTNVHYKRVVEYHWKQGEPHTNIVKKKEAPTVADIWKYPDVTEMLLQLYDKVPGARAGVFIHGLRPKDKDEAPEVQWKPWQEELLNEIDEIPDDRTIKWYWDPEGSQGKTYFTRYAADFKGAFVTTKANAYHLSTILQDFLEDKKNTTMTVIFNFTRQTEEHKVYQAIEQLKDGLITSEKYKGKTMRFKSPHVIVFANYLPKFQMCSLDRWVVRYLKDGITEWEVAEDVLREDMKRVKKREGLTNADRDQILDLIREEYEADYIPQIEEVKEVKGKSKKPPPPKK